MQTHQHALFNVRLHAIAHLAPRVLHDGLEFEHHLCEKHGAVQFGGGGAERRGEDAQSIVVVGRFGMLAADVVDLVVVFWVAQVDFLRVIRMTGPR